MSQDLFNKRLENIYAKIELPVWVGYRYGTEEYWKSLEREYNNEAKELMEFIRDHRSRDGYGIEIVKEYTLTCKFCGYQWPENFQGIADCCQEMIEAQKIKIEPLEIQ